MRHRNKKHNFLINFVINRKIIKLNYLLNSKLIETKVKILKLNLKVKVQKDNL